MASHLHFDRVVIHCATPRCETTHPHLFTEGFPLDASLREASWTYTAGTDKQWYCPLCSTPAAGTRVRAAA